MKRSITTTLFFVLFVVGVCVGQVPKTMNFQGVLKDATGQPLPDGTYTLSFSIYNTAGGGTALWTEAQNVGVLGGQFSTILGKTTPMNLNFDVPYWLGVKVQADPELSPRYELTNAPFAFRSVHDATGGGGTNVPVGSVIDWWRPNGNFPIPAGFQICDGSTITDANSPYQGFQVPNLTNKFIRGVTDPTKIGENGGSASHNHSVNPPSTNSSTTGNHAHSVDPPSGNTSTIANHSHTVDPPNALTTTDTHNHRWAYMTSGETWYSYNSSGTAWVITSWGDGYGTEGAGTFSPGRNAATSTESFYTRNDSHNHTLNISPFSSSSTGSHNHSLNLPAFNSSSSGNHNHSVNISSFSSGSASSNPEYVGLLKLMRIK